MDRKRYEKDRARADRFVDDAKEVLAKIFNTSIDMIKESTVEDDMRQGFDFLVPSDSSFEPPIRIAWRLRDIKYSYDDIVFRQSPQSNEFRKVLSGHVDYILYSWGDFSAKSLDRWVLVNCWRLRDFESVDFFGADKEFSTIDRPQIDCRMLIVPLPILRSWVGVVAAEWTRSKTVIVGLPSVA